MLQSAEARGHGRIDRSAVTLQNESSSHSWMLRFGLVTILGNCPIVMWLQRRSIREPANLGAVYAAAEALVSFQCDLIKWIKRSVGSKAREIRVRQKKVRSIARASAMPSRRLEP